MSEPRFDSFFQAATGGHAPYDYQRRLACGDRHDRSEAAWLEGGTGCHSQLINIPTGLGKTAAMVTAWLRNRSRIPKFYWKNLLRAADDRDSAKNHSNIIQ